MNLLDYLRWITLRWHTVSMATFCISFKPNSISPDFLPTTKRKFCPLNQCSNPPYLVGILPTWQGQHSSSYPLGQLQCYSPGLRLLRM